MDKPALKAIAEIIKGHKSEIGEELAILKTGLKSVEEIAEKSKENTVKLDELNSVVSSLIYNSNTLDVDFTKLISRIYSLYSLHSLPFFYYEMLISLCVTKLYA